MIRVEKNFEIQPDSSQLNLMDDSSLLFDIETTGLSSKYCFIYAIGCAYYTKSTLHFIQLFAENKSDEPKLIEEFITISSEFKKYISFNGLAFDTRFLADRAKIHLISDEVLLMEHIDLYKMIKPLKKVLGLTSLKQQYLENYLNDGRTDHTNGGYLTALYRQYLDNSDKKLLEILLHHNKDDVLGLVELCKLHSYISLFDKNTEKEGNLAKISEKECIYSIMLTEPIPKTLNLIANNIYLHAEGNNAYLKIPTCSGELKYFFSDYKNYWYYPAEDTAIHASLAIYGEKSHRKKATAKTAYTKKTSLYLPSLGYGDELFYDEYNGNSYIELTDKIKTPGDYLTGYLNHILNSFIA